MPSRTLASTVTGLALAVCASIAPAAHAAPDWTPPRDFGDPGDQWGAAHIGFTSDGLQIGARNDVHSLSPVSTTLALTERRLPGVFQTQFTIPTGTKAPFGADLAVAPNGAAVVGWIEFDPNVSGGPFTARAAYRTSAGVWGPPVVLANDSEAPTGSLPGAKVTVAIGDEGTAAAAITHLEASTAGETDHDERVDVRVHPPTGTWDNGTRLSAPGQSATDLELGSDADGRITAAWLDRFDEVNVANPDDGRSRVAVRRYSPFTDSWGGADVVSPVAAGQRVDSLSLDVAGNGRAIISYQLSKTDFTLRQPWVTRRATSVASFDNPVKVAPSDPGSSNQATVGVAPNGTYYVVRKTSGSDDLEITRATGAGAFSALKTLYNGTDSVGTAALAFRGNDPFVAWSTLQGGQLVMGAATWPDGAAEPLPATDLGVGEPTQGLTGLISDGDGSIVALWVQDGFRSRVSAYDGGAPKLTGSSVPSTGTAGTEVELSATFTDAWSELAPTTWTFGDGSTGTGESVDHTYAAPGSYTVTVRGSDVLGNSHTETFTVVVAEAPPTPATPPATPGGGQAPATPQQPLAPADTAAPRVTLALPVCASGSTTKECKKVRRGVKAWRTLTGTVSDAKPTAGIARVEVAAYRPSGKRFVLLSGGKFRTGTKAKARSTFSRVSPRGTKWSLKLPKLSRGKWTFRVRAVDAAGNVGKVVERRVTLR